MMGDVAPVLVPGVPASLDVQSAVYVVMGEPPSEAGGVNATVSCALPLVSVGCGGASGATAHAGEALSASWAATTRVTPRTTASGLRRLPNQPCRPSTSPRNLRRCEAIGG